MVIWNVAQSKEVDTLTTMMNTFYLHQVWTWVGDLLVWIHTGTGHTQGAWHTVSGPLSPQEFYCYAVQQLGFTVSVCVYALFLNG